MPPTVSCSSLSDNWEGHICFPPWEALFVDEFLQSVDIEALKQHANSYAKRSDCCVVLDKFSRGQESLVLELRFGTEMVWVVKLRLPPRPGIHSFSRKEFAEMQSEVVTMQYIKSHTCIPIPSIHGTIYEIITMSVLPTSSWMPCQGGSWLGYPKSLTTSSTRSIVK